MITPDDVLQYWFGEPATSPHELMVQIRRWFLGPPEVDAEIRARFAHAVELAVGGGLGGWEQEPQSCLALVLLLDQFTRNVFRGDARTYAGDARAQRVCLDAFDRGHDREMSYDHEWFLALPLLHAEDLALQDRFLALTHAQTPHAPATHAGAVSSRLEQAEKYRGIIARFGRFPHRNKLLGRPSTPEETEFLKDWESKARPSALTR